MTSMGSSNSGGYGGYDAKPKETVSVLGVAAQGVGLIASGVANTVMGGIGYLKGEAPNTGGSKMMGFGSESLSSQGGGNYAPPGGYSDMSAGQSSAIPQSTYSSSGLKANNQYGATKWGAAPVIDEKKPTAPASGSQEKKKKKAKKQSSSSEESSEEEKPAKKSKKEVKPKEDINLLEMDAPAPVNSGGFDFMNNSAP